MKEKYRSLRESHVKLMSQAQEEEMAAAGNQRIRPLLGGTQIQCQKGTSLLTSTLGLAYDANFFVTTGHSVGTVGSFVGQPTEDDMVGQVIANFVDDGVDMAQIEVLAGINVNVNAIWVGEGEPQEVTFEKENRPAVGENVWIQGAVSGKVQCSVHEPDADITVPGGTETIMGVILLNIGDATIGEGDSGAPVVGNNNSCYGVYSGRVIVAGETFGWVTPFARLSWP